MNTVEVCRARLQYRRFETWQCPRKQVELGGHGVLGSPRVFSDSFPKTVAPPNLDAGVSRLGRVQIPKIVPDRYFKRVEGLAFFCCEILPTIREAFIAFS